MLQGHVATTAMLALPNLLCGLHVSAPLAAVYRLVMTKCSADRFGSPDTHPQLFSVTPVNIPASANGGVAGAGVLLRSGLLDYKGYARGYGPLKRTCVQSCRQGCSAYGQQGFDTMLAHCWAGENVWSYAQDIGKLDTFAVASATGEMLVPTGRFLSASSVVCTSQKCMPARASGKLKGWAVPHTCLQALSHGRPLRPLRPLRPQLLPRLPRLRPSTGC